MRDTDQQQLGLLAKLVIAFGTALIVAGMLWHGVAIETFKRIWHSLVERPSGPVAFRFILQPAMAAIADGLKDVQTGRSPYFLRLLRKPHERVAKLGEGLNATVRIILFGLAMDTVYQVTELKSSIRSRRSSSPCCSGLCRTCFSVGRSRASRRWRGDAYSRRIS
jgi:hypothetical protein